jgi:flagellar biosynthetic protein FlhB
MPDPDKTEKATPKRREEARKQGNVAKSTDLTGAITLLAGLFVIGMTGPSMVQRLGTGISTSLADGAHRDAVTRATIGDLLLTNGKNVLICLAPIVGACALTAILVTLAQVGIKPKTQALKPNWQRLNPQKGIKRIIGKDGLVELIKNIAKVSVVAYAVLGSFLPHMTDYAAMVGVSPIQLGSSIFSLVKGIAFRATFAYLLIGVIDFTYQKRHHETSLKMSKQEIKDESKGQDLPAEVKGAIRRRQRDQARARMMADVPTADVIVTNPTHFSVALKYDGKSTAPTVIAKGQDLMALRIREIAADNEVPIVPDPPLARSLHDTVEVGQMIPEDLFHAVAQILAYVYRVAGRRRLGTA